jgi:hypothetical protein
MAASRRKEPWVEGTREKVAIVAFNKEDEQKVCEQKCDGCQPPQGTLGQMNERQKSGDCVREAEQKM